MDLVSYGHKFFIFGGAILIATAVLQVVLRPKSKDRKTPILDAGNLRVLLFVSIGLVAILMGTGAIPMPSGR
jgi:hypothetical protein